MNWPNTIPVMCFMYALCYFSLFYRWSILIKREEQKNKFFFKYKKLHAAIRTCHHYKNGKSIPFSLFAYVERISRESVELLVYLYSAVNVLKENIIFVSLR